MANDNPYSANGYNIPPPPQQQPNQPLADYHANVLQHEAQYGVKPEHSLVPANSPARAAQPVGTPQNPSYGDVQRMGETFDRVAATQPAAPMTAKAALTTPPNYLQMTGAMTPSAQNSNAVTGPNFQQQGGLRGILKNAFVDAPNAIGSDIASGVGSAAKALSGVAQQVWTGQPPSAPTAAPVTPPPTTAKAALLPGVIPGRTLPGAPASQIMMDGARNIVNAGAARPMGPAAPVPTPPPPVGPVLPPSSGVSINGTPFQASAASRALGVTPDMVDTTPRNDKDYGPAAGQAPLGVGIATNAAGQVQKIVAGEPKTAREALATGPNNGSSPMQDAQNLATYKAGLAGQRELDRSMNARTPSEQGSLAREALATNRQDADRAASVTMNENNTKAQQAIATGKNEAIVKAAEARASGMTSAVEAKLKAAQSPALTGLKDLPDGTVQDEKGNRVTNPEIIKQYQAKKDADSLMADAQALDPKAEKPESTFSQGTRYMLDENGQFVLKKTGEIAADAKSKKPTLSELPPSLRAQIGKQPAQSPAAGGKMTADQAITAMTQKKGSPLTPEEIATIKQRFGGK